MYWLTRQSLYPLDKPDWTRVSRPEGNPDFVFRDSSSREYVLEVTRLLPPELRNVEYTVRRRVCAALESGVTGTYILEISSAAPRANVLLPKASIDDTRRELCGLIAKGLPLDGHCCRSGLSLRKVGVGGNRIVPWITAPELPPDLQPNDATARELLHEFGNCVREGDEKFEGYTGTKLLVISIAESGLDIDYHRCLLSGWARSCSANLRNTDAIYVDPGIRVWQAHDGRRVLTGHRYVDKHRGYWKIYVRPGVELELP